MIERDDRHRRRHHGQVALEPGELEAVDVSVVTDWSSISTGLSPTKCTPPKLNQYRLYPECRHGKVSAFRGFRRPQCFRRSATSRCVHDPTVMSGSSCFLDAAQELRMAVLGPQVRRSRRVHSYAEHRSAVQTPAMSSALLASAATRRSSDATPRFCPGDTHCAPPGSADRRPASGPALPRAPNAPAPVPAPLQPARRP